MTIKPQDGQASRRQGGLGDGAAEDGDGQDDRGIEDDRPVAAARSELRSLKEDVCIEPGGQEGQEGRDTTSKRLAAYLARMYPVRKRAWSAPAGPRPLFLSSAYGAHGGENYRQNSHLDQILRAGRRNPARFVPATACPFLPSCCPTSPASSLVRDGAGEAEEEEDAGDGVDFVCAQDFRNSLPSKRRLFFMAVHQPDEDIF